MKKLSLAGLVLATLIVGSSTSIVSAGTDTCTPPAGWLDTGHRVQGQISYQNPTHPNTFFRCGTQTEQQLAAINAANRARDPLIHNAVCEGTVLPGHEAEFAQIVAASGLNCADPKYAQPPSLTSATAAGSAAGSRPAGVVPTLPAHP